MSIGLASTAWSIRSTWDYHLRLGAYAQWVQSLRPTADRLWNPPAIIRANLHKRYPIELAAQGVNVVPTADVREGDGRRLRTMADFKVRVHALAHGGSGLW
jgi:hypothetical protein